MNQECGDNSTSTATESEGKVEDAIVTDTQDKQQDEPVSETEDNEEIAIDTDIED